MADPAAIPFAAGSVRVRGMTHDAPPRRLASCAMTTPREPADLFDALPALVSEWADHAYVELGPGLPNSAYAAAFAHCLNTAIAEHYPTLAKARVADAPVMYEGKQVFDIDPRWMWLVNCAGRGDFLIQVLDLPHPEPGDRPLTPAERDCIALVELRLASRMNNQCPGIAVNFEPSINNALPILTLDKHPATIPLTEQV